MKNKNKRRFYGILLAGAVMMGVTAGCGNSGGQKAGSGTQAPADTSATEEAQTEVLPFEIYGSSQLEGIAEYELADISFCPQVTPSKPAAYAHVMTVADEADSYLDVAVRMKNLSGKSLYVSDIFKGRMELEGEEYYAEIVTEINDGTDLEQSHEMQPEEETIVHYLYEIDKNLSIGDITLRMVPADDETKVYEGAVNCGEFRENHAKLKKGRKMKTKDYVLEITDTWLSDELHAQMESTYSGIAFFLKNEDKKKTYAIVATKVKNKGNKKLDPCVVAGMHAIASTKKGSKVSEMCTVVTESESGQTLSNFAPDKIAKGEARVVYYVMEVDKKVKPKDLTFVITFDNMVYQLSAGK